MLSGSLRERLTDKRHRKEEPAERKTTPLLHRQQIGMVTDMTGLTASGCFQGHDKLLSMAPMEMAGPFDVSEGVCGLLEAVIDSWRL